MTKREKRENGNANSQAGMQEQARNSCVEPCAVTGPQRLLVKRSLKLDLKEMRE